MKTTLEKLENNRAVLTVEVESERVDHALAQASQSVARRVHIPGFRKGKAPRRIVERYVGKDIIWQEAIDPLLTQAYAEAVEETGIQPIDKPEIDILQMEDGHVFQFKASVDVLPEIKLGNYRGISVQRAVQPVTDENVEAELARIQEQHAELVAVEDGEVTERSFALIDFEGFIDGEPFPGGSAQGYLLEIGSGTFIGDFEEQLTGSKAGEEREVTVRFPDDYRAEDLAGKEAKFRVTVTEIKQKKLPDIDDELAKQEDAETLEELRKKIENNLKQRSEQEADRQLQNEVVQKVVEQVDVEIPASLVEHQIDHMVEDLRGELGRSGMRLEDYLAGSEKTMEDLRNDLREQAGLNVKSDLVLDAVAKQEGIEVSEDEIDRDIETVAAQYGQMAEAIREYMKKPENVGNISAGLRKRKTIERLTELALAAEQTDDSIKETIRPEVDIDSQEGK